MVFDLVLRTSSDVLPTDLLCQRECHTICHFYLKMDTHPFSETLWLIYSETTDSVHGISHICHNTPSSQFSKHVIIIIIIIINIKDWTL